MNKYIKDKATVLVWNGTPYSLVREEKITVNDPCQICDLADDCRGVNIPFKLIDLCYPQSDEDCWFFKVDWEIANKPIIDYLCFNPE